MQVIILTSRFGCRKLVYPELYTSKIEAENVIGKIPYSDEFWRKEINQLKDEQKKIILNQLKKKEDNVNKIT